MGGLCRFLKGGDFTLTDQTISTARDIANVNSVVVMNTNATSVGKFDVQSDRTITVRPETRFAQGSEVRLHTQW